MSFESYPRIVAVHPEVVDSLFPVLTEQYGELVADGVREIKTLAAFWDDTERTRIRAASLIDGTIVPTVLADGRLAFRALWQSDLAAAFEAGELGADIEELTEEQFLALLPPSASE